MSGWWSRLNFFEAAFSSCMLRRLMRSEMVKITNSTTVNETPYMVAIFFENRFAIATKNRTSVVDAEAYGNFVCPDAEIDGESCIPGRCAGSAARGRPGDFRKKLQTTPKA